MAILAHPDDGESLCGGTLAKLAAEGCTIRYLIATRGDKGSDDPEMTSERLMPIREQEQQEAAKVLGVQEIVFLNGYYDGLVEPTLELRQALTLALRQWKPDVVFTFDPWKHYEIHPDHRAIGTCAFDAIAAARGRLSYPEQLQYGITAHKVRQVYFFATDQPNHWVDIAETIEQKIEARCKHASQMNPTNHPSIYLHRWASEAGAASGKGYALAEAFHYYGL
ncbi:MAG: PIG-L deacetylase family protein [Ktedonobacteraceae bacterium]